MPNRPDVTILWRLARHALSNAVEPVAIGRQAVERAAWHLLDLFGCFLASRRLGVNAGLLEHTAARPDPAGATLWGTRQRVEPALAALAHGTVAHHLELDGGWHGPPGVGAHPAATVLPAALALAEARGASGAELLAAVAAGYDTIAVVATWLAPGITRFRLHPPALVGAFGAAAAAGRLLGLDEAALVKALARCAGATPLAPFEAFTAGANVKDLYGGWPGYVGLHMAQQAEPDGEPVEPSFRLHRLLDRSTDDGLAALAQLERPALLDADFKPYPTCRSVQPALTALERLLDREPVDPNAVAALEVETYPYAVELDESANEAAPIGARTSVKVCLALRLLHGPLRPEHFALERLADPRVRRLAEATTVTLGSARTRGASLRVRLANGSAFSEQVAESKWSASQPPTVGELEHKLRELAEPALGPSGVDELIGRTLELERLPSVEPLLELLAQAEPGGAACAPISRSAELEALLARWSALGPRLRDNGIPGFDPAVLDAVDQCSADPVTLSLALSLLPAGCGPLSHTWLGALPARIEALARAGFAGPPGVIDGPRGLGRVLRA
jgi:2-methylcitrate dehydratase PrpD